MNYSLGAAFRWVTGGGFGFGNTNLKSPVEVVPVSKRMALPHFNPWLITNTFYASNQPTARQQRPQPAGGFRFGQPAATAGGFRFGAQPAAPAPATAAAGGGGSGGFNFGGQPAAATPPAEPPTGTAGGAGSSAAGVGPASSGESDGCLQPKKKKNKKKK